MEGATCQKALAQGVEGAGEARTLRTKRLLRACCITACEGYEKDKLSKLLHKGKGIGRGGGGEGVAHEALAQGLLHHTLRE